MVWTKYIEIHPTSLIKRFGAFPRYYTKKLASKFKRTPSRTSSREFLSQNDADNLLWELNTEIAKKLVDLPVEGLMDIIFKEHSLSCSLVNIGINKEEGYLDIDVRIFGSAPEEEQKKIIEKIKEKIPYSIAIVQSSKSPNYLRDLAAQYKPFSAELTYALSDKNRSMAIRRYKYRELLYSGGLYEIYVGSQRYSIEETGVPDIKPEESIKRIKRSVPELGEELLNDVLFLEKAFP